MGFPVLEDSIERLEVPGSLVLVANQSTSEMESTLSAVGARVVDSHCALTPRIIAGYMNRVRTHDRRRHARLLGIRRASTVEQVALQGFHCFFCRINLVFALSTVAAPRLLLLVHLIIIIVIIYGHRLPALDLLHGSQGR
jgi:ABC-type xylose transport system permease subunit